MTVAFPPNLEQKIAQKAQKLGMTLEDFVLSRMQAWLDTPQQEQTTHVLLSGGAIHNEIGTMC